MKFEKGERVWVQTEPDNWKLGTYLERHEIPNTHAVHTIRFLDGDYYVAEELIYANYKQDIL